MRVRAIGTDGNWLYGKGQNDYLRNNAAVAQNIQTRLLSFLGNCFFDLEAGIDWFNYLGGKDLTILQLSLSTVILNTTNVTGLKQLLPVLEPETRLFTVTYQVQTTYSVLSGTFQYDLNGLV